MIEYNKVQLGKMAQQQGFVRDTFEKVLRLKEILKYFNNQPYLKEHLVLKGGTAINMVIFNLPRLSVDIDMDYIPNVTKDEMAEARAQITDVIKEYMEAFEHKEYKPELLFKDAAILENIKEHPMALWKCKP